MLRQSGNGINGPQYPLGPRRHPAPPAPRIHTEQQQHQQHHTQNSGGVDLGGSISSNTAVMTSSNNNKNKNNINLKNSNTVPNSVRLPLLNQSVLRKSMPPQLPPGGMPSPPQGHGRPFHHTVEVMTKQSQLFEACVQILQALSRLRDHGTYAVDVKKGADVLWSSTSETPHMPPEDWQKEHTQPTIVNNTATLSIEPPPTTTNNNNIESEDVTTTTPATNAVVLDPEVDAGEVDAALDDDVTSSFSELLDEDDLARMLSTDVASIRSRSLDAFRRTTMAYTTERNALRKEVARLRAELVGKNSAGSEYTRVVAQRDQALKDRRDALIRVRHLSRLLERTSAQIHEQAKSHEEALDDLRQVLLQRKCNIDWTDIRRGLPDMNMENKDDQQIVQMLLVKYEQQVSQTQMHEDNLEALQDTLQMKEATLEGLTEKLEETERSMTAWKMRSESQAAEIQQLTHALEKTKAHLEVTKKQLSEFASAKEAKPAVPFFVLDSGALAKDLNLDPAATSEMARAVWKHYAAACGGLMARSTQSIITGSTPPESPTLSVPRLQDSLDSVCKDRVTKGMSVDDLRESFKAQLPRQRHNLSCCVLHDALTGSVPQDLLIEGLAKCVVRLYGALVVGASADHTVTAGNVQQTVETVLRHWSTRELEHVCKGIDRRRNGDDTKLGLGDLFGTVAPLKSAPDASALLSAGFTERILKVYVQRYLVHQAALLSCVNEAAAVTGGDASLVDLMPIVLKVQHKFPLESEGAVQQWVWTAVGAAALRHRDGEEVGAGDDDRTALCVPTSLDGFSVPLPEAIRGARRALWR